MHLSRACHGKMIVFILKGELRRSIAGVSPHLRGGDILGCQVEQVELEVIWPGHDRANDATPDDLHAPNKTISLEHIQNDASHAAHYTSISLSDSLSTAQQHYCPECALLLRTYRVGQVGRVGWSAGRGEDMRLLLLEGVSQDRTNEVGAGVDQGQGVLQRIPDRPLETLKRNGRFQTTTRVNCN